jgi:hypothetical protein
MLATAGAALLVYSESSARRARSLSSSENGLATFDHLADLLMQLRDLLITLSKAAFQSLDLILGYIPRCFRDPSPCFVQRRAS